MALMTWDGKFSVNIKEIDDQHKKLFDLVNNLHDAMKAGKGKEAVGKVLNELISYTVYHFGTEEKLFQQYGYPEQTKHKKEHEDLTKKATDLKGKFDKGDIAITIEVMNFLRDWLNTHILRTDKAYSAFLNGKGLK
ncbi:MAG TPA: bacteriohemerythrin [Dissulfurispiraceae bacterium]